jgi:hypothetical protein
MLNNIRGESLKNDVLIGGNALENVLEIVKGIRPVDGICLYDLGTVLEAIILNGKNLVEDIGNRHADTVGSLNTILGRELFTVFRISDQELLPPAVPISDSITGYFSLESGEIPILSFEEAMGLWLVSELSELDSGNRFLESYMQALIIDSKILSGVTNKKFGDGTSELERKAIGMVIEWLKYFIRVYSTRKNFMPHGLFVPLFLHQSSRLTTQCFSIAQRLINLVHRKNLDMREKINRDFFKRKVFSSNYPFFLRVVLQNAKTPEDCLKAALKIRESRSAKKFRKWCSQIDGLISDEKITDREIEDALTKMARMLSKDIDDKSALIRILSLPRLAFSYSQGWKIGFSIPDTVISSFEVLKRLFVDRQLVFIRHMEKKLSQSSEVEVNVRRVFGKSLSEHDRQALESISFAGSLTS